MNTHKRILHNCRSRKKKQFTTAVSDSSFSFGELLRELQSGSSEVETGNARYMWHLHSVTIVLTAGECELRGREAFCSG